MFMNGYNTVDTMLKRRWSELFSLFARVQMQKAAVRSCCGYRQRLPILSDLSTHSDV